MGGKSRNVEPEQGVYAGSRGTDFAVGGDGMNLFGIVFFAGVSTLSTTTNSRSDIRFLLTPLLCGRFRSTQ